VRLFLLDPAGEDYDRYDQFLYVSVAGSTSSSNFLDDFCIVVSHPVSTTCFIFVSSDSRDDSVAAIPQTGVYQGAENIEECIKFTEPNYNPFLADQKSLSFELTFAGYDDGQCVFQTFALTSFTW